MDLSRLKQVSDTEWHVEPVGGMRVPGVLYGDEALLRDMDDQVVRQVANVARLPGIVKASYAMPDAHWGYGFPIGGVAAFDPEHGGVVSAGGVGFDISCGVRALTTGLEAEEVVAMRQKLADALFAHIPAGVGSTGKVRLSPQETDDMLAGGAAWAVSRGFGLPEDLDRIEERGCMPGALPREVSDKAKKRQKDQMGTLGSGNHYVEVQRVEQVFDQTIASAYGLREGEVVVSIHCGSRGLGHQIGTEFLKRMVADAPGYGLKLPDRELACAPLDAPTGRAYLGAMRAGINCALANRQIVAHLAREVFSDVLPKAELKLLYDVSHNTCKREEHELDGARRELFVHRKGATRAYGPGDASLPPALRAVGQPVLIGGTMGTFSYVLAGTQASMTQAFGSSCHGAGRAMSRRQASKRWHGRDVVDALAQKGVLIRGHSYRGVAEEAPGAYKDVSAVVEAAERAGLSRNVARLAPLVCVKG